MLYFELIYKICTAIFSGKLLDKSILSRLKPVGWNLCYFALWTIPKDWFAQSSKISIILIISSNQFRLICEVRLRQRLRWICFNCCDFSFVGGFGWHLDFFWELLPVKDRARRLRDATVPVPTPAIAGGLFAINREWFTELGIYDDGLEVSQLTNKYLAS